MRPHLFLKKIEIDGVVKIRYVEINEAIGCVVSGVNELSLLIGLIKSNVRSRVK